MKNAKVLFAAIILGLILLAAAPLPMQAGQIPIYVNGSSVYSDNAPWVNEDNRLFVPLRAIAEALGYQCDWNGNANSAVLYKEGNHAAIKVGSNIYTVNGKQSRADTYPLLYRERVMVPVRALSEALGAIVDYNAADNAVYISTTDNTKPKSLQGRTIVLDAGHGKVQEGGWTDPGAVGYYGLSERDVVMDIVYKTAAILQAEGAKVVLTRTDNYTYLTLKQRAAYAEKYGADIFISVHCNASTNRNYAGTGMYSNTSSYNTEGDYILAAALQKTIVAELGTKDIGLHKGSYGVLRNLPCPGVIAEIAFISNINEEKLLGTEEFRQKAAIGLAKGIKAYFGIK